MWSKEDKATYWSVKFGLTCDTEVQYSSKVMSQSCYTLCTILKNSILYTLILILTCEKGSSSKSLKKSIFEY